jgi:hypothetical protein
MQQQPVPSMHTARAVFAQAAVKHGWRQKRLEVCCSSNHSRDVCCASGAAVRFFEGLRLHHDILVLQQLLLFTGVSSSKRCCTTTCCVVLLECLACQAVPARLSRVLYARRKVANTKADAKTREGSGKADSEARSGADPYGC